MGDLFQSGSQIPIVTPSHADRDQSMLRDLSQKAWRAVSKHSRANQPLSIGFHFAAATEATARAIVDWLQTHGQRRVELESPEEADSDDWIIRAYTPPTHWTLTAIEQWSEMVKAAPLEGQASFMGWGV